MKTLRGNMMMLLGLTALMSGGMGMPSSAYSEPKRKPQPRKLSPEEAALELKERKAKFLSDLEKHNAERKLNFPKFKEHEIHGLKIIAFSSKNAARDMSNLMRLNYIAIQEDVQVQG